MQHRGGVVRSSDEGAVMAVERRGNVNWSRLLDNRKRDDLMIEICLFHNNYVILIFLSRVSLFKISSCYITYCYNCIKS